MNADPFFIYLDFISQDKAIVRIKKSIDELITQRLQTITILKDEESRVHHLSRAAHEAKKVFDLHELDIKSARVRLQSLTDKLSLTTSSKEYESLCTEINLLETRIDLQEDRLFELFDQVEVTEKRRADAELELTVLRTSSTSMLTIIDANLAHYEEELRTHSAQYAALKQKVNSDMLATFLAMKERSPDPVVSVAGNVCSACFNTVSVQDLVALRKHKLVPCQNCFRLLHLALT